MGRQCVNKTTPQRLRAFLIDAMRPYDLSDRHREVTADVLVTTDMWGVHTHGSKQLRPLLQNVRRGTICPDAEPSIVAQGPAWALINGCYAMPMVTAHLAMMTAIEKARAAGVGYAGVFRSSHFGAAGYYANLAVGSDMIGIAMSNVDPCMTVPGGRGKVLGTNPISFGVPAGTERPIFLDIATSAVAASKIFAARSLGQSIPNGWLVDKDGRPTTDPTIFPETGAQLPMAGHKGYGLAVLIEVLAAVLTGAAVMSQVKCWLDEGPGVTNQGHAFLAINIDAMMPIALFKRRVDALIQEIKQSPRAEGSERIYLPGEMEWERYDRSLKEGLQLPPDVVQNLNGLAQDVGIGTTDLWTPS